MDRTPAYCGIDVACAKGKALPVAVVVRRGSGLTALPLRSRGPTPPRGMGNALALDPTVRRKFADDTLSYLIAIEKAFGVTIEEIAIDAPRAPATGKRRRSELAMDRLGISCIPTPTLSQIEALEAKARAHLASGGEVSRLPGANQIWMLIGFELFRCLGEEFDCVEVFPNAIVQAIAPGAAHKSRNEGFTAQLAAFEAAAGWDRAELDQAAHGAAHDRLDALMSAWIASLPETERVAQGDGDADTIWSVAPRRSTTGQARPAPNEPAQVATQSMATEVVSEAKPRGLLWRLVFGD